MLLTLGMPGPIQRNGLGTKSWIQDLDFGPRSCVTSDLRGVRRTQAESGVYSRAAGLEANGNAAHQSTLELGILFENEVVHRGLFTSQL